MTAATRHLSHRPCVVHGRGLEQRVALPRDSYLQAYFSDVTSTLRVGPPLFLVVRDLNLSTASPDVDRVCSVVRCDDDSLVNQVSCSDIATP